MFKKQIIIDGKGHLLGRLAAVVAKQILRGQKIIVVRCEKIIIAGSLFRNKLIFLSWMNKHLHTNPSKGHYHYRNPARYFYKAVYGMVPRRFKKGEAALARLKVFDGMPCPYDKMKRMVVPKALKAARLHPFRPF